MPMARRIIPGIVPALTVVLSACGGGSHGSSAAQATTSQGTGSPASRSTPETNPAGDIPDNQVYVPFSPPGGRFTVKVPEGWARSQSGAATVFADKLNAIFGMVWHDGALYVMNMPHLTVFRDRDGDGKADERKELFTDMGVPAGSPNDFNDHIVSGLKIGIDG